MEPLNRFYAVRFADGTALRAWAARVLEFGMTPQAEAAGEAGPRPVVFVPLIPGPRRPVYAYVSEGAFTLLSGLGAEAEIDGVALSLGDLPDGLTLLFGDGIDAAAYERRRSPGDSV